TSPDPWQVGQRCEGTLPRPRHTGHGRCTAKPPWPNEMVPRPRHSGQVENVAPGAPPEPPHVGQTSGSVSVTGTLPPSAATRNGIEIAVSISSSSSSRPPVPRRPKIDENRSPSPPNEPRSDRSKSTSGPCAEPPPPPPPPPPKPPRPAPAKAPYRRSWSYFFRFSGSLSTSCASLISLKRSAACLLGLRSGWYCFARRRNAFLISSVVAVSDTPSIW